MPDLTFVFDVPVELALTRMSRELDRMESQGIEYLQRVRAGFLTEVKHYPAATVVIDARGDMESIQREVIKQAERQIHS
jgi:dTMP kinase